MKPLIRIYALPFVMVVTLATITGCATQGKPPPAITLDEPVAAHLLPEAPKPIEVVTLSEPLALPAQLKPLSTEADTKVAPEPIDEKVRVSRANLEARVAPSREGYVNAIQVPVPCRAGLPYRCSSVENKMKINTYWCSHCKSCGSIFCPRWSSPRRRKTSFSLVGRALARRTWRPPLGWLALQQKASGYADLHSQVHGEKVDAAALVPHMLAVFIERDRGFKSLSSKNARSNYPAP